MLVMGNKVREPPQTHGLESIHEFVKRFNEMEDKVKEITQPNDQDGELITYANESMRWRRSNKTNPAK